MRAARIYCSRPYDGHRAKTSSFLCDVNCDVKVSQNANQGMAQKLLLTCFIRLNFFRLLAHVILRYIGGSQTMQKKAVTEKP